MAEVDGRHGHRQSIRTLAPHRRPAHAQNHFRILTARFLLYDFNKIFGAVVYRTSCAKRCTRTAFFGASDGGKKTMTVDSLRPDGGNADPCLTSCTKKVSLREKFVRPKTLLQTVKNVSGRDTASTALSPSGTGGYCRTEATVLCCIAATLHKRTDEIAFPETATNQIAIHDLILNFQTRGI